MFLLESVCTLYVICWAIFIGLSSNSNLFVRLGLDVGILTVRIL